MIRELAKKFFEDNCSPAEAVKVLEWLQTPKGQEYLQKEMDKDIEMVQDEKFLPFLPEETSNQIWDRINKKIERRKAGRRHVYSRKRKMVSEWHIAAIILMLFITSGFYAYYNKYLDQKQEIKKEQIFATNEKQLKNIELSDGTSIQLNSNSEIRISGDYGMPNRNVRLTGEAYFEVTHNDKKPFIVHTPHASVKDLGTAFNVRALPEKNNVQVAVTQGRVTLWPVKHQENEAAELSEGQYAYLDVQKESIEIDEFGVQNYLVWMKRRLKFEKATLQEISRQLERIYDFSFKFSDDALKEVTLTADFESQSVEKAVEVISLTLDIGYIKQGKEIIWKPEENGSDDVGLQSAPANSTEGYQWEAD